MEERAIVISVLQGSNHGKKNVEFMVRTSEIVLSTLIGSLVCNPVTKELSKEKITRKEETRFNKINITPRSQKQRSR